MSGFLHDARLALRSLVRSPTFAIAVVLTLALGLGVNAAFFSIINAALLRPLPVREPNRLVNVYTSRATGSGFGPMSYADYRDLVSSVSVFEGAVGYGGFMGTVTGTGRAESVFGEIVTGNFFDVLGVVPAAGRTFRPDEDRAPGADPVVVLGYGFWQRRFGGDQAAIGRLLTLNGRPYTIVGVAPKWFTGMLVRGFAADLWVPTMMMGPIRHSLPDDRNERWLFVKARLAADVSVERAAAAVASVGRALERDHPATNEGRLFRVVPSGSVLFMPDADRVIGPVAVTLLAAAGLVLLVACVNLTGLLLVRVSSRRREFAVQLALGAGRARIMRQLLVEHAALAALGGALALLLAAWAASWLVGFKPPLPVPLSFDVRIDGRVAAYTAGLAALTTLLMGLLPARRSSRLDVVPALKGAGAGRVRRRRWSLRLSLLVPQVAAAFVLLLVAALFTRSVSRAGAVDPGFDLDHTALVALNLGDSGYDELRARAFYDALARRVEIRPGVRAVALTDRIPLDLYGSQSTVLTGEGDDGAERSAPGQMGHVGAGYFDAMGVAILRGHGFSAGDMVAGGRAVVVSAEAARRLWPGRDPIGRRLRLGAGSAAWFDVVGVAANVKVQTLGEVPVPFAYRPLAARHTGLLRVVARVDGDPGLAAAWLRQDAESLDDRVAVVQSSTMADVLGVMLFPFRMAAVLGSLLGLFTLGLAGVGLYGATAFALSRRRRELAIRVALGASPRDIVRVVLGGGVAAVAAGLLVGLPIAFAAARLAGAWLFGVTPADAVAYASAAGVLAAAAALALLRPARRAIRLDPMSALRDE